MRARVCGGRVRRRWQAGAAAYGLHPKLFGSPVSRALPRSVTDEVKDVRKDAMAEGMAREEREGLATPRPTGEEEDEDDMVP